MQKLEVFGAKKLKGQIKISGSKNASLPILAASLLSSKKVYLKNLPRVKDIETMVSLLQSLGSKIIFNKNNKFKITSKKNNYNINRLESNLLLIYTGKKRIAQDVAKKYFGKLTTINKNPPANPIFLRKAIVCI